MHKVAHHGLAFKRLLRMAADRCELMPSDQYKPMGVDHGTFSRWTSLDDDRSIPLAYLPTLLAQLDEEALDVFETKMRELVLDARVNGVPK